MITEDYVSPETAMLLKEKGFDGYCDLCFNFIEIPRRIVNVPSDGKVSYEDGILKEEIVLIPTLQTAMKWLRKKHNLHCHSDYDIVLGWYCQITSLTETVEYDYEEMKHYHPDKDNGFSSPEEACEAAIKYCLENLI